MAILRTVLTVVFILVCIVLSTIVLMQEGKSAGLGAISGMADSYWGKNKGRSLEGRLVKITKILAVAFLLLAIVLNIGSLG
ncbi:MAG: preprotein translocase subunit SecG [Lachnospiraceae bacterium]|nr:preprotein translocase subunit SecG [Lachnospiraceae bacterium]